MTVRGRARRAPTSDRWNHEVVEDQILVRSEE